MSAVFLLWSVTRIRIGWRRAKVAPTHTETVDCHCEVMIREVQRTCPIIQRVDKLGSELFAPSIKRCFEEFVTKREENKYALWNRTRKSSVVVRFVLFVPLRQWSEAYHVSNWSRSTWHQRSGANRVICFPWRYQKRWYQSKPANKKQSDLIQQKKYQVTRSSSYSETDRSSLSESLCYVGAPTSTQHNERNKLGNI